MLVLTQSLYYCMFTDSEVHVVRLRYSVDSGYAEAECGKLLISVGIPICMCIAMQPHIVKQYPLTTTLVWMVFYNEIF